MKKVSRINVKPPWEEVFPQVIGFCVRDDKSFTTNNDEEYYDYTHNDELIYKLGKTSIGWVIEEYGDGEMISLSEGPLLEQVLFQALTSLVKKKNNKQVTIIIPVEQGKTQDAKLFMYMIGGYPGSWISDIDYQKIRMSKNYSPSMDYLSYRKVPGEYVDWISRLLVEKGLLPSSQKVYVVKC